MATRPGCSLPLRLRSALRRPPDVLALSDLALPRTTLGGETKRGGAEVNEARYDYAWKTPGWTVQNPVVTTFAADGYVDPGLPADVSLVRVYGSFLEMDSGRSLEGTLRIRTPSIITYVPTGQQVLGGALRVIRFNKSGFSRYLPATDDPQLSPAFQYECRLTVRGVSQEFSFSLPAATPEVNITSLIPVS
jgi:hypothetical protein